MTKKEEIQKMDSIIKNLETALRISILNNTDETTILLEDKINSWKIRKRRI